MRFLKIIIVLTFITFCATPSSAMNSIAYRVNIETANSRTISVPVPKLKTGEYQINAIYIKTKQVEGVETNRFTGDIVNKAFEGIEIKKVNKIASNQNRKLVGTPVERLYKVEYGIGIDPYDLAQELMKNPAIEYAVPVFNRYFTDFVPNDPLLNKQWHLAKMNAYKAWEITKGSADVVIGIVDSAIDWAHPDLVNNIYHNPDEIPNNGIDDDNNGYIDDYTGWDFVGNISFQEVMNNVYKPDNNPAPSNSSNNHGTHVAGCASATTDNSIGIASIGFNTKILPVKCGSDNWGSGGTKGIFKGYEAMVYAADNGANIINCSWGGPGYNPAEQEIINSVVESGVLVVVSAGNDGANIDEGDFFPAGYDNVLAVGSVSSNDARSGFSNYGIRTDVFSPGAGIYSTLPGSSYGNMSGTSMAGPVAAGLAALVKAMHPDWTPHQIAAQLRSTTLPINGVSASNKPLFYGRIDALKAVQSNIGDFTTNKVKGMAFEESKFTVDNVLNNYNEKVVNLKLDNYLAPVSGVSIDFIAMDKFFEIKTNNLVVNSLTTNEVKDISLHIQLNNLTPWFDGFARILVKFTAEGYEDYQLIKIPIDLQTNNKYTILNRIQEENYAVFYDMQSPSRGVFWAVGQNRLNNEGLIYNTVANQLFPVPNDPVTGVYAFDKYNAWVVTGLGHLLHTTDGGLNWDKNDYSTITKFFNGIYFFNENNGIAVGDPNSGQFGAVATSNGGTSWSPVSTVSPLSGEGGLVGSHCILEDRIWFGTTKGRVLRGKNFGKTWSSSVVANNSTVIGVAFQSVNNGLAIYVNQSQSGNDVILAKSNDGGLNWTAGVMNFSEILGVSPVDIKYDKNSNRIYIFCEKGEVYYTENLGADWTPILSKQGNGYQRADISNDVENFSIYGINEAVVSQLDFTDIPEGAVATLLSVDGTNYQYDTTFVNSSHSKNFTFKNTGILTLKIDSVYFEGADKDAFNFFGKPPSEIGKGNTANILVRFSPKEVRSYSAKLVIKSNNEDGDVVINLTGVGKEEPKNSVEFEKFVKQIAVYPLPTRNTLNIDISYDARISQINLLDLSGKEIEVISEDGVAKNLKVDMSKQNSGVYLLQFVTGRGTFYKKVVKE